MNKTVQNLKREIEAIKKTQIETILEMENLGKRTGTTDVSITNRIQEMKERISGIEEESNISVKVQNLKFTKHLRNL